MNPRSAYIQSLMVMLLATGTASIADDASDRRSLRRTPVVEVFEGARNSVVNISSTYLVQLRSPYGGLDDLFEQLFDLPSRRPQTRKLESVGSGFVLHPDGYIVTNAHVVAQTIERTVIFDDKTQFEAQLVAIDEKHDLALLKIEVPEPIVPIRLGASDDLMIGETAIAIGNPLGYQHTLTVGVVSALERMIHANNSVVFEGLIQTDAPINPGNSGGPLLNVLGELIGITTAIRADAQGIGFAIPIDRLKERLPQLLDVERRYRIRTGMRLSAGVQKVTSLEPGGPAEKAGVRLADVVEEMDGRPLEGPHDYHLGLLGKQVGDRVAMRLRRGDQLIAVNIDVAERPRPDGAILLKRRFGITAKLLPPNLAERLGTRRRGGLVVAAVQAASPADQVGLRPGDVVIQLGVHAQTSLEDVGELLESISPGDRVHIVVLRISGNSIGRYRVPMVAR